MTGDVKKKKYYKKFKFNKENASKKKHDLRNSLKKLQNHFNEKYHSE